MNFHQFRNTFYEQIVFSTGDIAKEWPDFNYTNLVNWQDKGYLIKIRNSWYAFPNSLKTEADLFFLANRLRKPSYISLETALRYYNLIPESVFSITSVTTAKPTEWRTPIGHFSYRSLKPGLFFGYQPSEGRPIFLIAEPEKALLDMLYYTPHLGEIPDFMELRLNATEIAEQVKLDKIENYLTLISSPTLEKRWRKLQNFLEL
jgi:predicted transcriptional regulator of viral defense system